MFGFPRKKQPATPSAPQAFQPNVAVKETLARHNDQPTDKNILRLLYRSLGQGFLMVAVDRPPPVDSSGMVEHDAPIKMLSSSSPAGGLALLAFTDPAEALKRVGSRADVGVIALASQDVLKHALKSNNDGVVINPAGPWAYVPRSVLTQILAGQYA